MPLCSDFLLCSKFCQHNPTRTNAQPAILHWTGLNSRIWQYPASRISLSVTQSAFASTSDRPLCFPRACVGLIGPRPSDYPHALSACYYFLPAVFLLALGLWSSLPARQLSLDTPYSFLTFSVFFLFFFFFKVLKG